jgi:crossover junction endodeoxyribonuclease RuvC
VRVLGIDPGSRMTGWGVVEERGSAFLHLASGTLALGAGAPLGTRLARLYGECARLIDAWSPAAVVLERAFVARNVQSAFRLGEARGAVLAAVAATGITVHEYAPASVKLATVGYGQADKVAMARGIALRLALPTPPKSDAADALALALCHLLQATLLSTVEGAAAGVPSRRPSKARALQTNGDAPRSAPSGSREGTPAAAPRRGAP